MFNPKLRTAITMIIAGIPLCITQSATAQGTNSFALEEVVVTAERRALSLQDTPSSVVAITEAELQGKGIENLQDLQAFVPNLSIGGGTPTGQAGPDFSIRGISAAHGRIGAEKGVALYIDDLYYPRQVGSLLRLADVERVEVLRGPQGTLFGRNATGGAVRYITRKPTDEFEAKLTGTVGTSGRKDVIGLLNLPLADSAALRVQAGSWDQDGYVDVLDRDGNLIHDSGNTDDTAARAVLRLTPSENLTIDIGASKVESKGIQPASVITAFYVDGFSDGEALPTAAFGPPFLNPVGAQLGGYQAYLLNNPDAGGIATAGDPRQVSPNDETRRFTCYLDDTDNVNGIDGDYVPQDQLCRLANDVDNSILSLDINYQINDEFSIRYLGGIMDGDTYSQDILFGNVLTRSTRTHMESSSHELQLNYTGENLSGVIGYYFFNETPTENTGQRQFVPGGPFAGAAVQAAEDFNALDTTTNAVFGQLNIDLGERFSLILGARYSEDEKISILGDYDVVLEQPDPATLVGITAAEGAYDYSGDGVFDTYRNEATFDSFDWRVTGRYSFNEDVMVYGTVATGFKAGGFAADLVFWEPVPTCSPASTASCIATDSPVQSYDSEEVLSYELGIRADWADGRVRTNLSLFQMEYEDMIVQIANFNKPTGGRPELAMLNAGDADISGFEADGSFALSDNLTLNASVGYTSIDWQRLVPFSDLYVFDGTCSIAFEDLSVANNCGIHDLKRSPELSYTLGANYIRGLASGAEMSLRLNYGWTDETESNNGANSWRSNSYGTTSLRLQYSAPENWSLALFGTNILDEDYALAGLVQNGGGPVYTDSFVPARGAEWGLTLDYSF